MPKQPVLIENHLETGESPYGLLMVHQGRAITFSPPLVNVIGAFCDDGQGGLIAAAKTRGERFGYINASGDWLVAPDLLDARTFGSGKLARYCQDGLWGFMGLDGKPAIAPRWTEVGHFQHGPAAVKIARGHWRYIDEDGAFAFDGKFSDAGAFGANGLAPARISAAAGYGYLDRSGAWAITPRFALAQEFSAHGVASAAAAKGKHGLIDASGDWIVQPVHQEIRPFNADGLAYCSGRKGGAYLDASGNRFFEEARDLSGRMVDGVVRTRFDTYMRRDGELHVDGGLCWGGDFNEYGFALALTWSGRNRVDRNGDQLAGWGIVRTDGSFTPAPPNAVEPFPVDPEYDEFLDPETNTPLVVFVGNDNDLLMLDGEARIAFRLRLEPGSDGPVTALYDDQARLLWTSPASGTLAMPVTFFFPPDDWFYDELDSADQLEELARTMLRETEHKLHQLARDPHFDIDGGEEEEEREHDDYEREDDDDNDEEMRIAKTIRTRRRLSHFYNDEEVAGLYSCLGYLRNERQTEVERDLDTRLEALFGPSDNDPDFVGKPHNMYFAAWSFKLDTPVTDDDAVAPEANRLWLATSWTGDTGDGDEWGNVWLTCAPSIETLELALEARAALDAAEGEDEDEADEADEEEEEEEEEDEEDEEEDQPAALAPQDNSDALLELVTRYAHGIDQIPQDQVSAELADAAVAAHTDALQYLPARFQTEQRLEALIRRKLSTARAVPARCMSTEGLALARSLYGGDRDWDWHDQRHSAECTTWDQNSLSQRWGALIDTAYCERALLGGARYFYVPLWLRTPQLEAFALKADIDNLPYLSKDIITAEIAARAVSETSSGLLQLIPAHLVTHALCLSSVKRKGTTLEFVPPALRSAEVCMAAIENDWKAIGWVPSALQEQTCTSLIDATMAAAAKAGKPVSGTRWHGLRAWLRMHFGDVEGALEDARAGLDHVLYPIQARFQLAWCHRELGNTFDSALEAATLLQMGHFTPEFGADIAWLGPESKATLAKADEADLLHGLHTHPLALSKIPQRRITPAMAEVAVRASSEALEFVPKKLMTPELRALAAR